MRASLLLLSLTLLPWTLTAQVNSSSTAPRLHKPATRATATGHATSKQTTPVKKEPALTTDDEKTIYALGLSISRSLGTFDLTPAEVDIIKRALSDAAAGKPAEELSVWGPKINTLAQQRAAAKGVKAKAESAELLTKTATEPGVEKTSSGLLYKEVVPGTGAAPQATDTVKVNYRGTLADGTEFDKSSAPVEFPLDHVIRCWTEGLQKMKVGGKAILVCPADLAYGEQGQNGIPPGAALRFEVELLGVTPAGTGPK